MGDIDFSTLVAKLGIGGALLAWVASIAVKKWAETRTGVATEGAKTDVIDMLAGRVSSLEEAVDRARKQFDDERALRLEAQQKVVALTSRVAMLEAKLRNLGHDPDHHQEKPL